MDNETCSKRRQSFTKTNIDITENVRYNKQTRKNFNNLIKAFFPNSVLHLFILKTLFTFWQVW